MKIIIEVRGGCVIDCYTDSKDAEITLVDWDNIQRGDSAVEVTAVPISLLPPDTKSAVQTINH